MKKQIASLGLIILNSCVQTIEFKDMQKINGYWEIEKVIFSNGKVKEYGINETYEFFSINAKNKGFRKKVKPQLDGKFLTNNTFEEIEIIKDKAIFMLIYKTSYSNRQETLQSITDTTMTLVSKDKISYFYKKVKPFNILNSDEKIK